MGINRVALLAGLLISFLAVSVVCELKFVLNINRHGARGPIYTYGNRTTWASSGQLTAVGMRQLYLIGREFRTRYIENSNFLPDKYDSNLIFVHSTRYNRTVMSALSLLYGLYPEGTGPVIAEEFPAKNWDIPFNHSQDLTSLGQFALPNRYQPIPVHTNIVPSEYVLQGFNDELCPAMSYIRKEQENTPEYKRIMEAFDDVRKKVAEIYNISYEKTTLETLTHIMDTTVIDYYEGNDLPVEYGSLLWKQMHTFLNISVIWKHYRNRHQINVYTTPAFHYILSSMDRHIEKKSPVKLMLLSAHDVSILDIAVALNLTSWECYLENYINDLNKTEAERFKSTPTCAPSTDIASSLRFELHQKDNSTDYEVKIFYEDELYPLNGKNATDYSEFKARLQAIAEPNFAEVCRGIKPEEKVIADQSAVLIWIWVFVGVLFLFVSVLGYLLIGAFKEMNQVNRRLEANDNYISV